MPDTLAALTETGDGVHPALGGDGRPWLDYDGLRRQAAATTAALHGLNIGRGDRVAIVLPNGPEMASAFLCLGQAATTAPLNPAYGRAEYDFYLGDLNAKALLVAEDYDGPALEAAQALGVAILRLSFDAAEPAGTFRLTGQPAADPADTSAPGEDDVALILHTSGTTSRPKIVPLLQRNVAISARNVAASLGLSAHDRSLHVMPLFHIHGLIASLAASMSAGGSVWCAPGFNALRLFAQIEQADPTWITAVPTMHQLMLARAEKNRDAIAASNLRFLRSSSASLPAPVMEKLAATFGVPVIEAYGMTEAAHQMCCNPMAPGAQRPGSVGRAAGPEVAIAHETENRLLQPTAIGEVVISGPNVTPGYEANPEANEKNFFEAGGKRWFRTGDQGAFDAEGYLTLTGRLKEIINRGGEKISPLEVDAALLEIEDVAQAVCFAVPHPKLGEDIAAAVVPREGATLDPTAVRARLADRLAAFKVPSQIVVLDEIPKGGTGKVQRIGLAAKLGLC